METLLGPGWHWSDWPRWLGGKEPKLPLHLQDLDPVSTRDAAEALWSRLQERNRLDEFLDLCDHPEHGYSGADAARLLAHLRLAVASAIVARWLVALGDIDTAPDSLLNWMGRASGLPEGRRLEPNRDFRSVARPADPLKCLHMVLVQHCSLFCGLL